MADTTATTSAKAKRSQWYTFLNVGSAEAPDWQREGKNASEMTAQMNPQTSTNQDVTQDTGETDITGYQPNIPVSKSVSVGDPVFTFIDNIRRKRAILSDSYTQILNVDVFNKAQDGSYPAEKQDVSVQIDTFGGAASSPLTIGYTYNYRGDPVLGTATIAEGKVTFTPAETTTT
ncbi:MAG: hypothetical protein IJZ95_07280 [Oscillospiraceae bacterium]|nr:hypothetical protein [Oscillospiraceae bacterium]